MTMARVGFAAGLGIVAIEELDLQSGYDFFPVSLTTEFYSHFARGNTIIRDHSLFPVW